MSWRCEPSSEAGSAPLISAPDERAHRRNQLAVEVALAEPPAPVLVHARDPGLAPHALGAARLAVQCAPRALDDARHELAGDLRGRAGVARRDRHAPQAQLRREDVVLAPVVLNLFQLLAFAAARVA